MPSHAAAHPLASCRQVRRHAFGPRVVEVVDVVVELVIIVDVTIVEGVVVVVVTDVASFK